MPTKAFELFVQLYVKVGAPVTFTEVIEPVDALQLLGATVGAPLICGKALTVTVAVPTLVQVVTAVPVTLYTVVNAGDTFINVPV